MTDPASPEPLLAALPPAIATALRARTPDAEERLSRDPWAVLLAEDLVSVEQGDRYAQSRGAVLSDERRSVALVRWLLDREARAGHTWLGADPLLQGLAAAGVDDPRTAVNTAIAEGVMLATEHRGDPVAAVAEVGAAEEALAEELARLACGGGVKVVAGPPAATGESASLPGSESRNDTLVLDAAAGRGRLDLLDVSPRVVVRNAERLSLQRLASLLARVRDDSELVLIGDPLEPLPGPGDPLGDLVRAGNAAGVRVAERTAPPGPSALERLRGSVRDGVLPPLSAEDTSVVVVPVADDAALERRLTQVLTVSLPQRLGIPPAETAVVVAADPTAVATLSERLRRQQVVIPTVVRAQTPLPDAGAVVVVVPPTGLPWVDRRLLVAAANRAGRQLTVLNGLGPDLPAAVAAPLPRRRTRLLELLAEAIQWQRDA